ncbi:glycerophosphodiester phosphodiesterase [Alkanindiges sp. WGS2144]|uniref:glycerophosphodiester phosphodiesterase n=1 Tax=Alkanindiges sp. WGS2144 TaxID=3366808 RepID=UPI003750F582
MRLIGHRGARHEAPENTLGGFRHIIELGLKAVEFDVRLLADQQLAVIHDDNFLRTSGLDQSVAMTSAFQLVHTDNRVGWDQWPQPEPTPLLTDVLSLIEHFEHIEIEVKAVNDEQQAQVVGQKLHHLLEGWQDRVSITSFDLKVLQALKEQQSSFKRGLLVELPLGEVIIDIAKQLDCSRIGLRDQFATQELVKKIHAAHMLCSVWTVNNIERARQLAQWQIDGLITDIPTQMIQANIKGCIV